MSRRAESIPLTPASFDLPPVGLAKALLGKVLRRRVHYRNNTYWLSARVIEAEAYEQSEKASHSSLGRTPSREAMFGPPGTIYMYYARGADSLNFSARGDGNAVLIKSAVPVTDGLSPPETLDIMHSLNPGPSGPRPTTRLCSGQTLLCRSLDLKVPDWNNRPLDNNRFRLDDDGYRPARIIQTRRLGIPDGRDEHLMYRFIDADFARYCTSNPLTKRQWREGRDYRIDPG